MNLIATGEKSLRQTRKQDKKRRFIKYCEKTSVL